MNDFRSVAGKVAVVTGATSGIGEAIARMYAANGMKVVLAARRLEKGEQIVKEIREAGGEAVFCQADVTSEEEIKKVMKTAVDTYGQLNVVVNNAGVGTALHPIHEYETDEFRRICNINYMGVFLGMKYGVQAMLDTKSMDCAVINISSANGLVGTANFSAYDASKRAVNAMSQTAALDYAKHDITVNVICPGVIDTEIYAHMDPKQKELSAAGVPMGRFGRPEEIAYMALFLASGMARYVTGSVIAVDAGMTSGTFMEIPWNTPDPIM